jgi:hypothetical protein
MLAATNRMNSRRFTETPSGVDDRRGAAGEASPRGQPEFEL